MLEVAIKAAMAGGKIIEKYFEEAGIEREVKDDKSFVTKADKEAEAAIIAVIKESYPDHSILAEEGGGGETDSEYQWVIDPLDGTSNFVNGLPLFAVSIALLKDGVPIIGVIHNPVTNSMYAAEKGKGVTYNGKNIRVSPQQAKDGLVTFGPGKNEKKRLNTFFVSGLKYFKFRRYLGCTALELAYVARGGTEAYVCLGLNKWDYAAGVLLVEEAGGKITDWEGNPWTFEQNYFLASNGVAHDELLQLVKE